MRVVKLSEHVYAASFSNLHSSYLDGFPQRERQLLFGMKDFEIYWFKHPPLTSSSLVDQLREDLTRYIKKNSIELILFDNPLSSLLIDDFLWSVSVFDCCDWYFDYYACEFGEHRDLYRLEAVTKTALARCQSIIFQSSTMEKWARGIVSGNGMRSIVLPNGYNPEYFYPGPSSIKFDKKTALFAGKLGRWYDGLKTIALGLPDGWQLILVGDGPCRPEYSKLNNVHCTGRRSLAEVGDYMRAADVCVFPVDDCSPIATSEYLACAKPVVHRGDRITWMIEHRVNGYIVPDDADRWRDTILEASDSCGALRERAQKTPKRWSALQAELHAWLQEGR